MELIYPWHKGLNSICRSSFNTLMKAPRQDVVLFCFESPIGRHFFVITYNNYILGHNSQLKPYVRKQVSRSNAH